MTCLILASNSPRRREILENLGWTFEIVGSHVEERELDGEKPADMALRLASAKSKDVSARRKDAWVLGADTVVDIDGLALEKPLDRPDALRMVSALSGRSHLVHTGIALSLAGNILGRAVETTKVTFGDLSREEIDAFVESGEGDDKAGAYAIQGRGALLVERIEGCYFNVVGLPVFRLNEMLKRLCGGLEPCKNETGDESQHAESPGKP